MKITFVGHASILIETKGLKILSDPWWGHPCFGAQWWTYPLPYTKCINPDEIDYIYISHGHHDHFHPGTLRQFTSRSKILVSSKIGLEDHIKKLGFDVICVDPNNPFNLSSDVRCFIWPTHSDDTLMVIDDSEEICINANDALHSAPIEIQDFFISKLKQNFSKIDYLFCGYGVASHFPNCYKIPSKNDYKTAFNRQLYFNEMWTRIVEALTPCFAFPFAADVAFLENDLFFVNEPTQEAAKPVELFQSKHPNSITKTFHIAPGFIIENNTVIANIQRGIVDIEKLKIDLNVEIEKANRYGNVDQTYIESLIQLLNKNISICKDYLVEYGGDYKFGISLHNSPINILIEKIGSQFSVSSKESSSFSVDVMLITRASYLKQSLSNDFGQEILFVGSGGVFEYYVKDKAMVNLHRELKIIVSHHATCPSSRYGASKKTIFAVKKLIKDVLGIEKQDLYDLKTWIVYDD